MTQVFATLFAVACTLAYLLSYRYRNGKFTLWVLIGLSFLMKLYLASLTDILNIWDEQFHALVAKNLSETPLTPRLYPEALIDHDYRDWSKNHIWLHKPPLFLWLIAISIKFFGTTALAVRLPSVILSTLTLALVALLARKTKGNDAAWWVTVIFSLNPFLPLLVTGNIPTDHNDVAFAFFIALSYFLWHRYLESGNFKSLVWLSLSVAACILNKWLLGLWIYLPFGIYLIRRRFNTLILKHFIWSVAMALVLPVAWYLYIHSAFPAEAAWELSYNARHFLEPLEGHRGPATYYFGMLPEQYGIAGTILVITGLAPMYRRSPATLTGVLFVFVFFSLAATKMPAFTFWISSVLILYGGIFTASVFNKIRNTGIRMTLTAALVALLAFQMDPEGLYKEQQTRHHIGRLKTAERTKAFLDWADTTESGNYVVMNLPPQTAVYFMFFTDAIGYDRELTAEELEKILARGKTILDWKTYDSR